MLAGFYYEGIKRVDESQADFTEALTIAYKYPKDTLARRIIKEKKSLLKNKVLGQFLWT